MSATRHNVFHDRVINDMLLVVLVSTEVKRNIVLLKKWSQILSPPTDLVPGKNILDSVGFDLNLEKLVLTKKREFRWNIYTMKMVCTWKPSCKNTLVILPTNTRERQYDSNRNFTMRSLS